MAGKRFLSDFVEVTISGEGWIATFNYNQQTSLFVSARSREQRIKCAGGLDIRTLNSEISKFDFWAAAQTGKASSGFGLSPVGARILKILSLHLLGFTSKAISDEMELPTTTVRKVLKRLKSTQYK